MARTEQEIFDAIIAEKNSGDFPELTALNSTSNTAIWRLLLWINAKSIHLFETIMDLFRANLEADIAERVYGHKKWIAAKALLFQYGDEILFDGDVPYYALEDESKRVVGRVAVVEVADGTVLIKVTHADGTPLSNDEQLGLLSYFDKILPAGTIKTIISLNPDRVRIYGDYYYDPQYDPSDITADIQSKNDAFYEDIDYNGALLASEQNALFKTCLAYKDWYPRGIEVNVGGVWTDIGRKYIALSGAFLIDDTYSIDTTITLIPYVQS